MKKSLQLIEDHYINLGFKGDKLRHKLFNDKEYTILLKEKKKKLSHEYKISESDKKKYVLATNEDLEILYKCNLLKKMKLSSSDKELVKFIKTQLLDDWRTPILKEVEKLVKKYKI
ncbi:hypothetical protein HOE31_02870 [bacterium]|jgi:hypothetical protein|nr:hypothetical protein [bacterium]MBT4121867.1 hypothetical protein [bacterium]MBT4335570.1 hypothetical protein [bacterium]MBT4496063.1 hypothetical protein [bacterium]MBT4764008.1 hypothetical protein [bacterium]